MTDTNTFDCFFLTHNQSHASRIVEYFEDPDVRQKLFPAPAITDGIPTPIELGPKTYKKGPCLVHLKGLSSATSSPQAITQLINSTCLKYTIGRSFYADSQTILHTRQELIARLRAASDNYKDAAIRLQCQPRDLEPALVKSIQDVYTLDLISFTHVLYVIENQGNIFYSIQPADTFFRNSPDGPKRSQEEFNTSKAAGKLDEALQAAGFTPPVGGVAIDLGAAPGGWTTVLAQRGLDKVLAVDPAELFPQVLALPNVVHIKQQAKDSLAAVFEYLEGQSTDLLVCDINIGTERICEVIGDWFQVLKPGGLLVLTLKFYGLGRDRSRLEAFVGGELKKHGFGTTKMVWLFANTSHERTCLAWKC